MEKKLFAAGIILLFVGVTIAPTINQSAEKSSNENVMVNNMEVCCCASPAFESRESA